MIGAVTVVLDASIVVSWVLPDERTETTDGIMDRVAAGSAVAPSLLWYEVRNTLAKAVRRDRISFDEAAQELRRIRRFDIASIDLHHFGDATVFDNVEAYGLTAYDAAYLVCAAQDALPLATLDKALARAARSQGIPLALD